MSVQMDLVYNASENYTGVLLGISEQERLARGYNHSSWVNYASDHEHMSEAAKTANHSDWSNESKRLIFIEDDNITDVSWTRGILSLKVSADTHENAQKILKRYMDRFPKSEPKTDDEVSMSFWTAGRLGATRINRKLLVPEWSEIENNYSAETHEALATMMNEKYRPGAGGKLILWQGEPGTGKTTAIRALSRSWKDWARFNYITDPEKFWGPDAEYMFGVITDGSNEYDIAGHNTKKAKKTWSVLVLEDCGELLAADARQHAGQGLSRFLNCVDGLIGQGLNIIVLVTTNEELGKLHPAVQRPGRTANKLEFKKLTAQESSEWLDEDVNKPMTIAELYAKKENFDNKKDEKQLVGFLN